MNRIVKDVAIEGVACIVFVCFVLWDFQWTA